jgi:hypothetical protein
MTFAFEKLLVYQKSVDFADGACCYSAFLGSMSAG